MHLIVDNWKTFIGKKENRFELVHEGGKEEYCADDVSQIIISAASSISIGAIKLAMEKGIDIVLMRHRGEPAGRIYPCKLGGTTLTRKRQLEAYFSDKGFALAKKFIEAKIRNQVAVLKALAKTRTGIDFSQEIARMEASISQIEAIKSGQLDDVREQLLGFEGNSANEYFQALSKIVPIEKRDRKGGDGFNAMLNYAYGIMYSEVEKACILAGLDPYFGYLHTDRYGKPSMVLDLIEEFRAPIADKAVINLFSRKQVSEEDFEKNGETFFLSERGRKKVVEAVMRRLYGKVDNGNKTKRFKNVVVSQARSIARFVLGQTDDYKPFLLGGGKKCSIG
ncbi:MAG: CRISPR-associated endonuclease Cas1 [Candidatus Aenigmatarchaeota archaeon]